MAPEWIGQCPRGCDPQWAVDGPEDECRPELDEEFWVEDGVVVRGICEAVR
jgi:hypothetical protein